ncbi:MAG: hypothetical protein EPN98_21830 [Phenylobacterium sp.]|uniref:hypothetical protein n=1 Tax=Phenylobacterium sp. TaxID=1871053 RepID=UPI00121E9865|nr:hypothetical protein [Phenylobacterium sp.]TAL29083.1 MAG: hypothetical protein EPN98_21830 [Phenylobacterium sp.]
MSSDETRDWRTELQAHDGDDYAAAFVRHIFSQRSTLSLLATTVGLEEALRLAAICVREASAPSPGGMGREGLLRELAATINRNSAENGSNTPDFILATFLSDCLAAFDKASSARERWYGRADRPGTGVDPVAPQQPPPVVAPACDHDLATIQCDAHGAGQENAIKRVLEVLRGTGEDTAADIVAAEFAGVLGPAPAMLSPATGPVCNQCGHREHEDLCRSWIIGRGHCPCEYIVIRPGSAPSPAPAPAPAVLPVETPPRNEVSTLRDEVTRLKSLIDRDRTGLAFGLDKARKTARGYRWICEGRGPYAYDDDRYREETGRLVDAIVAIADEHLRASGELANEAFHPPATPPPVQPDAPTETPCPDCELGTNCVSHRKDLVQPPPNEAVDWLVCGLAKRHDEEAKSWAAVPAGAMPEDARQAIIQAHNIAARAIKQSVPPAPAAVQSTMGERAVKTWTNHALDWIEEKAPHGRYLVAEALAATKDMPSVVIPGAAGPREACKCGDGTEASRRGYDAAKVSLGPCWDCNGTGKQEVPPAALPPRKSPDELVREVTFQVRLWDAISEYAASGSAVYGNVRRQKAVTVVNEVISALITADRRGDR